MYRTLVWSLALILGAVAFVDSADARCHHRRARRHGCGGCGGYDGGYAPAYYDGKGSYEGYAPDAGGVPAPPPPPPAPAPRAT